MSTVDVRFTIAYNQMKNTLTETMARPSRHGETKGKRTVYVSDEAWEVLDKIADDFMLSRSELLEMVGRGRLQITKKESKSIA